MIDKDGAVVARERRLGPSVEVLLAWLAPLGADVATALEATLYWAWLHDRLTAAHAQQVTLICAARCKTDPVDAAKLAELLRMDLLPAIWIPDGSKLLCRERTQRRVRSCRARRVALIRALG